MEIDEINNKGISFEVILDIKVFPKNLKNISEYLKSIEKFHPEKWILGMIHKLIVQRSDWLTVIPMVYVDRRLLIFMIGGPDCQKTWTIGWLPVLVVPGGRRYHRLGEHTHTSIWVESDRISPKYLENYRAQAYFFLLHNLNMSAWQGALAPEKRNNRASHKIL